MRYWGIWVFLLTVSQSLYAQRPSLVHKNNEAFEFLKEEKTLEAKKIIEKEVVNYPDESILHFNLGVISDISKEQDKALSEYLSASEQTKDSALKFMSYFNMAQIYADKKDISKALEFYQKSLEIDPHSKEVKTNIELLLKDQNGGGGDSKDKKDDQNNSNNQDKKDQQDQKDQSDQNKDQNKDQNQQKPKKPQPKPFKSKDLSEKDVKTILDELKRQEEQIRAKMNNQKSKEQPIDKDW